ncbi:MAG: porin family protein [Gammaproteobacteria bacterium]|nr:porin family protein [Gammaproteobacteria bacterium]
MKKLLIVSAIALISTSAFADENSGPYVNVNGGVNLIGSSSDAFSDNMNRAGLDVGGALGYRFNENFRAEAAFNYLRNTAKVSDDITFSQYLYMANVYYDFGNFNNFVPYVGVGAGCAHQVSKVTVSGMSEEYSKNSFAAQGIIGVDYKINQNVALGVNYHFLPVFLTDPSEKIYNNLLGASITFSF